MLFQKLEDGVGEAERRAGRLAVLVMDLDGFKKVNDRFGHATGNLVLQETAEVLKQACRKGDCVARMGGDEFVLLLADTEEQAVAQRSNELDRRVTEVGARVCGVDFFAIERGRGVLSR